MSGQIHAERATDTHYIGGREGYSVLLYVAEKRLSLSGFEPRPISQSLYRFSSSSQEVPHLLQMSTPPLQFSAAIYRAHR
jgi:hypothetical protein